MKMRNLSPPNPQKIQQMQNRYRQMSRPVQRDLNTQQSDRRQMIADAITSMPRAIIARNTGVK